MRKIDKFMFLVPNNRWFGKRCWLWFTPAVALLVPILKKNGITAEVIEANIDNLNQEEIKDRISAFKPDMVGVPSLSLEYWRAAHLSAKLAKEVDKSIITVMGGAHPTTLPSKVMEDENVDFIILAEAEERLINFIKIIESGNPDFSKMDGIGYRDGNKIVIKKALTYIKNLDDYPLPDYSFFNWEKAMNFKQKSVVGLGTRRTPVGLVHTARGCRFNCCFCTGLITMGRGVRFRHPDNVLKEIDMLVKDFKIRELIFTDDEMYADRERCVKIFEGLKKRKYDLIWKNTNLASWLMDYELVKLMKETGCYQITISPESGSNRVLKEIIHKPGTKEQCMNVSKWCRELDIELEADFVIGFPGETWDEIRQTTNFAEELDADAVKFAIATPFPGTELFDVAVKKGYLPADFEFYRDDTLGFAHGVIETEEFTVKELEMLRCMEWDRINFKTPTKIERYAKMNGLTLKELKEFRKNTRRNVGVYYMDQAQDEREEVDKILRVFERAKK